MPNHLYNKKEICQKCGLSRGAVRHFKWGSCEFKNKPMIATFNFKLTSEQKESLIKLFEPVEITIKEQYDKTACDRKIH